MINPMYEKTKIKKPTAIIFDLDGVLCDSSLRFNRIDLKAFRHKDKEKFVASLRHYCLDCEGDKIIPSGAGLLWALCDYHKPDKVLFITARGIANFDPTMKWLKENNIFGADHYDNELIMNPEDLDNFEFEDFDHASWKGKTAAKLAKQYEILIAVDDSEANVRSFVSRNIPTLKFIVPGLDKLNI